MSSNILMPAFTPTMEEGSIVSWLVSEGDAVSPGDVIAEIETDKSIIELEAPEGGVVQKILIPADTEGVKVGSIIAVIGHEGGAAEDSTVEDHPSAPVSSADDEGQAQQGEAAPAEAAAGSRSRVRTSPAARRKAAEAGIDLKTVTGSGPDGRVLNRDIDAEILRRQESELSDSRPSNKKSESGEAIDGAPFSQAALSTVQKVAATRLVKSKQTIPHFYLKLDVEIDKMLALRKKLNSGNENHQTTVNDFVIRAAALALREIPDLNVQFSDDKLIRFQRSDIAVAVAVEDGLVAPVVRNADNKSVVDISTETKELIERARAGKLLPDDYQGGTFTISNLGMHGIDEFIAIINPPQAAILALGQGNSRTVVKRGGIMIATIMKATLSCDHRAVDGVIGAKFLKAFKELIENPDSML